MKVLILAGGYGTRLYPLTYNLPKPLVKLGNKPLINLLMEKVISLGEKHDIDDILVVSNNKFHKKFEEWGKKYKYPVTIINDRTNNPQERLGAVGDINFAIGKKRGDWLVLGGDNIFQDDLVEFIDFSYENRPHVSVGLQDVKTKKEAAKFGVVEVAASGKVLRMEEKPQKPFSTLAASCVYFFPEKSINFLNCFLNSCPGVDASGKYISWLVDHDVVYGYTLQGRWFDIGSVEDLKRAKKFFNKNL